MFYRAGEKIRYCAVGRRVVFLDLERNRYFGLPAPSEPAFLRWLSADGQLDEAGVASLSLLTEPGYLVPTSDPIKPFRQAEIEPPTSDLWTASAQSTTARHILLAFWWQITAALRLRLLPFWTTLAALEARTRRKRGEAVELDREARFIAAAFDRLGHLIGRTDQCLVRSVAQFHMSWARGVPVRLVIGVRCDPFAAHCWVQREGSILNDSAENVRNFTPLLVVG